MLPLLLLLPHQLLLLLQFTLPLPLLLQLSLLPLLFSYPTLKITALILFLLIKFVCSSSYT